MKTIKIFLLIGFFICVFSAESQEIKTYSGSIPYYQLNNFYTYKPSITYDYYEDEDFVRVYHGPVILKFEGEGSNKSNPRWGKIEGQFKDGYYDGEWEMIVPMYNEKKSVKNYYTAIIKCNFNDGVLDGPVTITMKDRNNNVMIQTNLNYLRGRLDGEISHFNHLPVYPYITKEIMELNGQYHAGKPVGRWVYLYQNDKGIADFDNNKNYTIDNRTGEKKSGIELELNDLWYLNGLNVDNLIRVLGDIGNDREKDFRNSKLIESRNNL